MNNEPFLSDEDLRSVTARPRPDNPDLTLVHEAFRSLGDSLTNAVPPLDKQALLQRLKTQSPISPPPATRTAGALWLVAASALAAAVLIAIVHIQPAPPTRPVATSSHYAPRDEAPIEPTPPNYTWHDPIDEEIAIAAAAMNRLSGDPHGVDASLLDMNEVLSALSQELSTETL